MFIRNTNCLDFKVPLHIFWQPREIWHHRLSGWGFEKWERDGSDVSARKTKNKLYQEPINLMGSWLYQYQSGKLNTESRAQSFLRAFAFSFAVALLFLNLPAVAWYGTWVSWVNDWICQKDLVGHLMLLNVLNSGELSVNLVEGVFGLPYNYKSQVLQAW